MSFLFYFVLAVYVVVIGLISYAFYSGADNKMPLKDALYVAAWPLIVVVAPFYIAYVLWKDKLEAKP